MATPPYIAALDFDPTLRSDAFGLMRRLVEHFRHKSTDQAEGQYGEPVSNYADPDVWQQEMARIHQKVPLPVALSAELPEPGTHKAMDVAGRPVLITRAERGRLRPRIGLSLDLSRA